MPDPVPEILAALEAAFRLERARWYLFGAQAVILWGAPRTSVDIDVTVEVDFDRLPQLIERLGERGFELRIRTGVDDFVARARVLPFLHRPSGTPVDVVLAGPGFEELFLTRAVPVTIGGLAIPVISPEDLVVTKVLAGRPKDVEDVRGILAERAAEMDLSHIREMLRLLEDALGQSDLVPLFEAELRRATLGGATGA